MFRNLMQHQRRLRRALRTPTPITTTTRKLRHATQPARKALSPRVQTTTLITSIKFVRLGTPKTRMLCCGEGEGLHWHGQNARFSSIAPPSRTKMCVSSMLTFHFSPRTWNWTAHRAAWGTCPDVLGPLPRCPPSKVDSSRFIVDPIDLSALLWKSGWVVGQRGGEGSLHTPLQDPTR